MSLKMMMALSMKRIHLVQNRCAAAAVRRDVAGSALVASQLQLTTTLIDHLVRGRHTSRS